MNREINLINNQRKSKRKTRFSKKKNRSPINLGMVVVSPNKNTNVNNLNKYRLKIKNKKKRDKINLSSKSPVQNLKIRSPLKHTQNSIKKYIKVTKKVEPKTYTRFNKKTKKNIYKKSNNPTTSKYNHLSFRFCKNLYEKNEESYFSYNILEKIYSNFQFYKNLPIEDKYLCASITDNIVILYD